MRAGSNGGDGLSISPKQPECNRTQRFGEETLLKTRHDTSLRHKPKFSFYSTPRRRRSGRRSLLRRPNSYRLLKVPDMASQVTTPAAPPSAHVVGNVFVEQYYSILHHKPEEVFKFYKDSSVLSRPDSNGEMTSVTTMQAIDEIVKSLDYKSYKVVIWTVDAQHSYKDGVVVLVTGCLTGEGNSLQKFTQSFFLAPQESGGFFVLNDVFRYVCDSQPVEIDHEPSADVKDTVSDAPVDSVSEPSAVDGHHVPDPVTALSEDKPSGDVEVDKPIEENAPAVDVVETSVNRNITPPEVEVIVADAEVQEDVPKKSYASIVKFTKRSTMPSTVVSAPTAKARIVGVCAEKQAAAPVSAPNPASETSVPDNKIASESNNSVEEVEGFSIYIRNLPLNATPSQLEAEFKKFGLIKPGGVQVRNHKQHGYCFGFVEFEELASMQKAIKESPVIIAGREAVVEEKRTTTRVGSNGSSVPSGRGRFPPSRGGFRNDNFRGRGGFGSGQGYGRGEFRSRGEFSGRGRGPSGRSGEGYLRVGRVSMNSNNNPTAVTA